MDNLYSYKQTFSIEFFYQARPYITGALTLSGWFFSIWTASKLYKWRSSTYILLYSNLKHSSQSTVYRRPCWDIIVMSQLVHEWDGHICDVFATSHWYVDKTSQFEMSQQRTNWYLSESLDFFWTSKLVLSTSQNYLSLMMLIIIIKIVIMIVNSINEQEEKKSKDIDWN